MTTIDYLIFLTASARAILLILLVLVTFTAIYWKHRVLFGALTVLAFLGAYSERLTGHSVELLAAYVTCISIIAIGWNYAREESRLEHPSDP